MELKQDSEDIFIDDQQFKVEVPFFSTETNDVCDNKNDQISLVIKHELVSIKQESDADTSSGYLQLTSKNTKSVINQKGAYTKNNLVQRTDIKQSIKQNRIFNEEQKLEIENEIWHNEKDKINFDIKNELDSVKQENVVDPQGTSVNNAANIKFSFVKLSRIGASTQQSRVKHMILHRGILICKLCGNLYTKKFEFLRHIIRYIITRKNQLNINVHRKVCLKSFRRKKTFKEHMSSRKSFKCEICLKLFTVKVSLAQHMRIHREKPFKCDISLESSKEPYTVDTHTDEKQFKCEICLKSFTIKGNLVKHMRIHTGEKPFKCETCSECFLERGTLNKHILRHTGEKPFKCEICSKCFTRTSNLIKHKRIHTGEKPFKCDICLKDFSQSYILNKHLRCHTGEKPFKCEICLKSFSQRYTLSKHILRHTGEKPFKCEICIKLFASKSNLVQHVRCHNGEKPFECHICFKLFTGKGNLVQHERIHTGEKPFGCVICLKTFRIRDSLNKHMRYH